MGSALQLRAEKSQCTIRANFPIVQQRTFLNNAYWHPLSFGAKEAIQAYLERKAIGSTRYSYVPAREKAKANHQLSQLIAAPLKERKNLFKSPRLSAMVRLALPHISSSKHTDSPQRPGNSWLLHTFPSRNPKGRKVESVQGR
jgi:hypothetical protein